MNKFELLLEVADTLNGPEGCPWDKKQTFHTLQPYVLEEAHEVIEAVDSGEDEKIIEELGDLLYTVIFYGKLAQKEGRFTIWDIIETVREKLIRRHPHVFADLKVSSEEEVVTNWNKIKQSEKEPSKRKGPADGIPPTLPLLAKAQKIIGRMLKTDPHCFKPETKQSSEEEIGQALLDLILAAERSKVDAESALRRSLSKEMQNAKRKTLN